MILVLDLKKKSIRPFLFEAIEYLLCIIKVITMA